MSKEKEALELLQRWIAQHDLDNVRVKGAGYSVVQRTRQFLAASGVAVEGGQIVPANSGG